MQEEQKLFIGGLKSGFDSGKYSRDSNGYALYAKDVMRDYLDAYNHDGIDIDFEGFAPDQPTIDVLQGVYNSSSVYLGPQSGTSKWLIMDTKVINLILRVFILKLITYFFKFTDKAYLLFKTITQIMLVGLSSNKILPGFSFREKRSGGWGDVNYLDIDSDYCYKMTRWNPTQGQMEVISLMLLKEIFQVVTPDNIVAADYYVTKKNISILNPEASNTSIVPGATYQLVLAVNNISVLDVEGAGTSNIYQKDCKSQFHLFQKTKQKN